MNFFFTLCVNQISLVVLVAACSVVEFQVII